MNQTVRGALASLVLVTAACSNAITDANQSLSADAFAAAITGFSSAQNSFSEEGGSGLNGGALGGGHGGRRGRGFGLMAGGLDGAFWGTGIGRGFGNRPGDLASSSSCAFDAGSGRVSCAPDTRNGLTIVRSFAFANAAGQAQSAFDSLTTNSVNVRSRVTGTTVFRGGAHHGFGRGRECGPQSSSTLAIPTGENDTTTVEHASDRTVTGLAQGSTQRTVKGTSAAEEVTTGVDSVGAFTVTRVAGDTTTAVVIPVSTTGPSYPTAGTIVRAMRVTVARNGQTPQSSSRREVITYDGSATASVVITQDGQTSNCTLPLPRGRLVCQ
jgi:hypothetical protein